MSENYQFFFSLDIDKLSSTINKIDFFTPICQILFQLSIPKQYDFITIRQLSLSDLLLRKKIDVFTIWVGLFHITIFKVDHRVTIMEVFSFQSWIMDNLSFINVLINYPSLVTFNSIDQTSKAILVVMILSLKNHLELLTSLQSFNFQILSLLS